MFGGTFLKKGITIRIKADECFRSFLVRYVYYFLAHSLGGDFRQHSAYGRKKFHFSIFAAISLQDSGQKMRLTFNKNACNIFVTVSKWIKMCQKV